MAGVEPLEDVTEQPFDDDENWTWSLATATGPHADLLNITVSATYDSGSERSLASYSISRLLRDPLVFEEAAAAEAEAAAAAEDEL